MGHRSTVWRIEAGRSKANPAVVRGLCWLYGVDEQTSDALYEMAMQRQKPGWWVAYGSDLPSWFTLYVGLEAEACRLSTFQQSWVHGLLQTPEYARAVLSEGSATTGSELDRQVAIRLDRQRAVFERPEPLDLRIVLDEGALRRPIGGLTVLREQQDHLRLLNRRPHIEIRVLPIDVGWHPALRGGFTVLDMPDPADPDVVYIEAPDGARYLETAADLERFRVTFMSLQERSVGLEEFL